MMHWLLYVVCVACEVRKVFASWIPAVTTPWVLCPVQPGRYALQLQRNDTSLHCQQLHCNAGVAGRQICMDALQEFLGMIPHLTEAGGDDSTGSVLAGCERDTKHLAFKALTLLQQVWCDQSVQRSGCVHGRKAKRKDDTFGINLT